ncbi:MAG: DUF3990 domain-containing protein [Bacteroidales bacterium]|jgi:hypothetical protein|nr:DUF3990 domain-containing protein [Bacteroidales bacterium]MEE0085616.1 DUF3990 domain-containing protein [Paludibacteraceae bacterium]
MILYHGSNLTISQIDLSKGNPNKDFGKGFYLTENKTHAEQIAKTRTLAFGGEPTVNQFEFNEALLTNGELKFKKFIGYTEEWARFVCENRDNPNPNISVHDFDVVYGPIANDNVGLQIRKYQNGDIDIKTFLERLKYMKGITYQFFFGTELAISKLHKL